VGWSVPLRTIAAAAPESTIITGLSGDAEVEMTSKSLKSKKQLIVNFATPMSEDGSMPREIEASSRPCAPSRRSSGTSP